MTNPSLPIDSKRAPTIRRKLALVPALAVTTALIVGAAPADAGLRRVALGVWDPDGNRNIAVYDQFRNAVGRQPAIITVNSQWGNPATRKFPASMANKAKARGARLMITWSPVGPPPIGDETGQYSRWQRINAGKHDKYIKNFARAVKKHGAPVIIRFAHEVNASYFPWTKGWGEFTDPNTGQKTRANDNTPKKYKRGDKYVDYMGFSSFNWGPYRKRGWVSMVKSYTQPVKKFKAFTSKPIIVAETASHHKGGNKAKWIRKGYGKVYDQWNKVKAIVYLDTDEPKKSLGHPDWRLVKPGNGTARDAYTEVSSKAKFQGSLE